jgi:hypothetical protein
MNMKVKNSKEKPKAKVKYYVKTKLHTKDGEKEMKYKQVLAIREPPVKFKEGEEQSENSHIKTWCCIDQGQSAMWATFEKNVYTPAENARATINVDNKKCKLPVTKVCFFI